MSADSSDNGNDDSNGGEVTALHDLIAGGIAGSASVIVGHPFDTIKVRLQTMTSPPSSGNGNGASSSTSGGFKSLFKGMGAPLSTAAIVNAIIFATYGSSTRLWEDLFENGQHDELPTHGVMTKEAMLIEHGEKGTHEQTKAWKKMNKSLLNGESKIRPDEATEQLFSKQDSTVGMQQQQQISTESSSEAETKKPYVQNTLKVFACGSIAGTVQAFVICPMEHIKCRLQVQAASIPAAGVASQQLYKGPIDCGLSIIKNHGVFRGLYRGMGVTLWRETPAFGLYFATYDSFKERVETLLEDKDDNHPIPSHAHAWTASALAGGISGAWTWAIIYPFDVIKSRMQTGPLERHLQKGMWTVAGDIVREHGWQRMFRGLGITLVRAFPVNAIIFPVYEFVLMKLGDGD